MPLMKSRRSKPGKVGLEQAVAGKSDAEIARLLRRSRWGRRKARRAKKLVEWWLDAERELLGSRTDAEIAAMIGRSTQAVRAKRIKLGIQNFVREGSDWTPEEEYLLGTAPDAELAARLRRRVTAIRTRRCIKRIPPFEPKGQKWLPDEDKLLGTRSDSAVA